MPLENSMLTDYDGHIQITRRYVWHVAFALPLIAQLHASVHTGWYSDTDVGLLSSNFKPHWHGLANKGILECDVEIELIIPVALHLLAAAKTLPKELVDDIIKVMPAAKIEMEVSTRESTRESMWSRSATSKLSLLVICGTLLRIAQRVIGFVDLLEQGLAVGIALV